ncbi:MerR family transcriptional regulator [Nonomuraea rhodomycinica]|uniref:MerR family transcriptional regulator n=1 Tax=Nonomuraea rhodomycinica TaxID=1712872 RepID=A0A7Y6IIX4_9ACTN|nr:MerR family transcriptional regulator [Nonomuraea rhodomycinica]NUW38543.1 MerR family transcriptional regulator [Nonomuraea rhodomycinica]
MHRIDHGDPTEVVAAGVRQDIGRPYLRSGQAARQAGVNPQTLRHYERRGLIAEPARSPGGHRAYPPQTVTLLTVIKAAQRLGFTLDEVADLTHCTCPDCPLPFTDPATSR